ncbi:DUF6503 family protein [Adhaeribacter pallidiroseus]|uniref:Deoxyribose-phosphate aldolase n=1 Tax=Adhaeribacter pallidiroseus TaxID=2072847 RepID=A0A369QGX4_9BACT|nr:DUF6503 family protein [Adhaeribacter pallidiroseus]RDC62476.1 hypothetical protein AHMF7616_01070 [Adhaeribacter pallidiroseus]
MRTYLMLVLFLSSCFWLACQSGSTNQETAKTKPEKAAQEFVDRAITTHGGKKFENLKVAFDFRNRHYEAIRKGGAYTYTRSFTDSTGQVKDVLTNDSFIRTINDQVQKLPEERVKAFTASINSVIYFALLPFGLNDPTVKKELLDTVNIQDASYAKVKVAFKQEGGGTDFQDEFLYYINQKTGTLDYFAYTYATEGGGIRFRQAINPRMVGEIRFQDYVNYEPTDTTNFDFWQIEKQFTAGKLKEFSKIELQNIQVRNRY